MAREQTKKQKRKEVSRVGYRFILEPYRSSQSRITCPNCRHKGVFARYVDTETGEHLDDKFGRCNRVEKCGYFNPPTGDDIDKKSIMIPVSKMKKQFVEANNGCISLIDSSVLLESMTFNDDFSTFLIKKFGPERAMRSLLKYKVGESDRWKGSTIFWQIDQDMDVRTGKIIPYDENGKRIKVPYKKISWVHVPDKKLDVIPDYNLRQCMFGEHLIPIENDEDTPITFRVVEAEKTAVICDINDTTGKSVWVSIGGLELISAERLQPLHGRKIVFYPDKGDKAFIKWKEKIEGLGEGWDVVINRSLENTDLEDGSDLADLILSKL